MEQIIVDNIDDLEASRYIHQALLNVPQNYPYRDMAIRSFGMLIWGMLGLMPQNSVIIVHEDGTKTIEYKLGE